MNCQPRVVLALLLMPLFLYCAGLRAQATPETEDIKVIQSHLQNSSLEFVFGHQLTLMLDPQLINQYPAIAIRVISNLPDNLYYGGRNAAGCLKLISHVYHVRLTPQSGATIDLGFMHGAWWKDSDSRALTGTASVTVLLEVDQGSGTQAANGDWEQKVLFISSGKTIDDYLKLGTRISVLYTPPTRSLFAAAAAHAEGILRAVGITPPTVEAAQLQTPASPASQAPPPDEPEHCIETVTPEPVSATSLIQSVPCGKIDAARPASIEQESSDARAPIWPHLEGRRGIGVFEGGACLAETKGRQFTILFGAAANHPSRTLCPLGARELSAD